MYVAGFGGLCKLSYSNVTACVVIVFTCERTEILLLAIKSCI